jgi:glycosyltransferase involved in cell wall biosynthesis
MRQSLLILRGLAKHYSIEALTRVAQNESTAVIDVGDNFREHRIPRTGAESEWQAMLRDKFGPQGGDDAMTFDWIGGLNPAFMSTLNSALEGAIAVICIRPFGYAALRSVWSGPVVYDALELEYRIRARMNVPNFVEFIERLVALEQRCAAESDIMLCGTPHDRRLATQLYGRDASTILTTENVLDSSVASTFPKRERTEVRQQTNLRESPFAFYIGSSSGDNARDVAALCSIATYIPSLLFLVAGRVVDRLQGIQKPPNLQFTGEVDDATVDTLFRSAECLVVAGSERDRAPRKVLDAIAYGCPIVATMEATARTLEDAIHADIAPIAEIPSRIALLFNDPQRGSKHARIAHEYASATWTPDTAARPLLQYLATLSTWGNAV